MTVSISSFALGRNRLARLEGKRIQSKGDYEIVSELFFRDGSFR
jgi:hypothetical protein